LAVSHSKLGRLAQATGDLDTARRHYEKAVAVLEFLVARTPRNHKWQWDLVVLYHRAGDVAQANESAANARDWYLKSLELADQGFARSMDPEIARFRIRVLRSLAQCHRQLGEIDAATACEQRIADLGAPASDRDEHRVRSIP
jgi:tetratricopeptide (TPR) repeat protein